MALDTYTGLKASIADWLARADLTAAIPDFITLTEAQLNRELRTTRQLKTVTNTLTSGKTPLPDDFGGVQSLTLQTDPVQTLSFVGASQMGVLEGGYAPTGRPTSFNIGQGGLEVVPAPDDDYSVELTYYARVPALSEANQTNWLLEEGPDVYLYGSLGQAAPYLKDDARVPMWAALYTAALSSLNAAEARFAMGPRPAMRIRRYG